MKLKLLYSFHSVASFSYCMQTCLLYKINGVVLSGIDSVAVPVDLQQQIIENDGNSRP